MTTEEKLIRAVLQPYRDGLLSSQLAKEFRGQIGKEISFRALGFRSLEEYLLSISQVCELKRLSTGEILVTAVPDKTTRHISQMVARQKVSDSGYNRRTAERLKASRNLTALSVGRRQAPDCLQSQVKSLMNSNQGGLASTELAALYANTFGSTLDLPALGYIDIQDFCRHGLSSQYFSFSDNVLTRRENTDILCGEPLPIPEHLEDKVITFLCGHPKGIPDVEFNRKFYTEFGFELRPLEYNFSSLKSLLSHNKELFHVDKNWRVFYAKQEGGRKEELPHRTDKEINISKEPSSTHATKKEILSSKDISVSQENNTEIHVSKNSSLTQETKSDIPEHQETNIKGHIRFALALLREDVPVESILNVCNHLPSTAIQYLCENSTDLLQLNINDKDGIDCLYLVLLHQDLLRPALDADESVHSINAPVIHYPVDQSGVEAETSIFMYSPKMAVVSSLEPGRVYPVAWSYISSPRKLWVFPTSSVVELWDLSKKMTAFYSDPAETAGWQLLEPAEAAERQLLERAEAAGWQLLEPNEVDGWQLLEAVKGQLVVVQAARYFCRARVLNSKKQGFQVLLLDSGERKWIDKIYRLHPMFLELAFQGIQLKLRSAESKEYSGQDLRKFKTMVKEAFKNNALAIRLLEVQGDIAVVDLLDTSSGGVNLLDTSCGGVDLLNTSSGGVNLLDTSCGRVDQLDTSSGGVNMLDTSCGGVNLLDTSCGGVNLLDNSYGGVDRLDNSCGRVDLLDTSCGGVYMLDTSCGGVDLLDTRCGGVDLLDTSCGEVDLLTPAVAE